MNHSANRSSPDRGILLGPNSTHWRNNDPGCPRAWASAAAFLLLLCSTLAAPPTAFAVSDAPGDRPAIFLQGATVARARALALDSALLKGWALAHSAPDHIVFETWLEEPAGIGPPNALPPAQTLLRIRADFVQTPAGVNAYLYAEEVWYAGSSKEWVSDVTGRYRSNLSSALSSLQQQWTATAKTRPGGTSPSDLNTSAREQSAAPKVRVDPAPPLQASGSARRAPAPPAEPEAIDYVVGIWAYHAEQYAIAQGCELGDLGATMVSGDAASELHRVHCNNGTSLMVRCDRERCYGAR